MLLDIKNLHVHYAKAEALKGISLNIEDKEIVALIGTNGAGKTTLMRTISGLKTSTSGEIWFNSEKINKMPAHEIVKLGIVHVPEGRMVFAPMTVLDNLKMGAYLRKNNKEILNDIENIYEHFPILRKRHSQLAGSLSGGEQQMLAVARALMAKPKLVLMDEPSMGLAPIMVAEVGKIIKNINEIGISIILVEQNARLAFSLASRAYVMEIGEIKISGESKELAADDRIREAYLG